MNNKKNYIIVINNAIDDQPAQSIAKNYFVL